MSPHQFSRAALAPPRSSCLSPPHIPAIHAVCVWVFSSQRRAAALAAVASGKVTLGGAPVEGGAGEALAAATLPIAKQGDLTLYSDVSGSVHS